MHSDDQLAGQILHEPTETGHTTYTMEYGGPWFDVVLRQPVANSMPTAAPDAQELLLSSGFVKIDDQIIDTAMLEPDPMLRSLDAIHLATARAFGSDVDGLATYDDRLAAAATAAGMTVVSPRD